MRLIFAASDQIAVPTLQMLLKENADWELVGLLSAPPARRGRRSVLCLSDPVCALQEEMLGPLAMQAERVTVLSPESLNSAARAEVSALKPDLLVTFAYGKIFGPKFLALFPRGGINIHPSLLPALRGPCPIPAAIQAGCTETGISIQKIALEMDRGDILAVEHVSLDGRETCASLSQRVAKKTPALLEEVLRMALKGELKGQAQDEVEASYCELLEKDDGLIDWATSAQSIDAQIRAFNPWPGSHTYWDGTRLAILEASPYKKTGTFGCTSDKKPGTVLGIDKSYGIVIQTGKDCIAVQRLQARGRKALDWQSFLNGNKTFATARLGSLAQNI